MNNDTKYAVWWNPQVPGAHKWYPVDDVATGLWLMYVLSDYDIFQYRHKIKPDYTNAGGLVEVNGLEKEDWCSPDGDDTDEVLDSVIFYVEEKGCPITVENIRAALDDMGYLP